jgi:hypothetical protein
MGFKQVLFMAATILAAASLCFAQGSSPDKKPYVRTGNEVTITGTVTLKGQRPLARRVDTSADPVCTELEPSFWLQPFEGNSDRLGGVFVYVNGELLQDYKFETPSQPAILEHKNCRYSPHLLGIQVNQPLQIFTRDPTMHNTHPVPRLNAEWNRTQPPNSPPLEKSFARPEAFIAFKDNQHPWERAYLGVFSHPFFVISDDEGNFRIEGLPPGKYTVIAWHDVLGEQTFQVELVSGESRFVSFEYEVKEEPKEDRRN